MIYPEDYPIHIPTWNNGKWEETEFKTKDEFVSFVESLFKEPGQYEFDETIKVWQQEGLKFRKNGYYFDGIYRSKEFIEYWEDQKRKSRIGVIYTNNNKVWYLPRDYYFWINFLPIYDKVKKKYDFPQVWDIQYHMSLYELLARLHYKHAVIVKKRQIASSYYHTARLINKYWFEEGAKLKIGASDWSYVDDTSSWKMIKEYADFLNEHTAWIRHNNPDKVGNWEQKIEVTINGRKTTKGLKSTLTAYSFEKSPTKGVGGPTEEFFHEEAGIAPKMDDTYEFMRPALQSGQITTGMFIAAGSVGDLKDCAPLEKFINNPEENGFYAVENRFYDDKGNVKKTGLFLPEQWSMPPYIDEYGNSLVEEALKSIEEERAIWKKTLDPNVYKLRISQKPINLKEAFDFREENIFPLHLVSEQKERIDNREYFVEYIDLDEDDSGRIIVSPSKKSPIDEFPVSKKREDKEGCICVWERPINNPPLNMYYASIDPVGEGRTITSDSLCAIYVYKSTVEMIKNEDGERKTWVEPGRIVAAWCGRFDDINKTHKRLELIIKWYNARTIVENNISLFIQHMLKERLNKYLVPKNEIVFLKQLGYNANSFQEYGWRNTGKLFSQHLLSYAVEFTKEVIYEDYDENGKVTKLHHGIERIPDPMLLIEMNKYKKGLNVDRLVAFSALVAYVKIQESNLGRKTVELKESKNNNNNKKMFKFKRGMFSNIGKSKTVINKKNRRNPFKNIR